MKTTALIAFLQLATVLVMGQSPRPSGNIVTEFEDPAILSDNQIHIVKDLALRAGLPSVSRIYTYNIHPSSSYGIGVQSKEETTGRESTTSSIHIGYEKWSPGGSNGQNVKFRSGEFWAQPWIHKSRFATFAGPRGSKKIGLSEKTPLAFADKIFALFEAGKLRFKTPELKKQVDEWRTSELTLTAISWEIESRGNLGIAVEDRHAHMGIECIIEEGEIVVIDVIRVIS